MGLFHGSATLTRYQVAGKPPENFSEFLDERVRRFAFRSIEEGTEELATGWVSPLDYLDTQFAYAGYLLDPFVVLGLRVDRRRVVGALLKKYHRLEMQKARAQNPEAGRLSRTQRDELKEKTRLMLMRRLPPLTQSFDVCWDLARGQVLLGAAGQKVRELFEELFTRSFGLKLVPLIPWSLAQDLLTDLTEKGRLEQARPLSLHAAEA